MTDSVINLTRGVPPGEVFPVDEIRECLDCILAKDGRQVLTYNYVPGYAPLRELLAECEKTDIQNIFPGSGSLEIVNFLSSVLLKPGERAFVESPTYDRVRNLFMRTGAEVVGIPMENDGVNLDAFEAALHQGKTPRVFYTIADFHNPLGSVTSELKRRQVARWAEEYGFWVIEDSPYRLLRYHGEDVPTVRSFAPERVIQLTSISKLIAPGLRVGWAVGPQTLIADLTHWALESSLASTSLGQATVYEYMRRGLYERNIETLKGVYAPRLDALAAAVDRYLPGSIYPKPEGGFFIGVTLPEGCQMADLLARAPQFGLKITDGRGFYVNPKDGERFLRIPFATLSPADLEEATRRVAQLIKK